MYTDYNEEKEESYYADDDNKNNGLDKEKLKRIVFFVLVFVILIILIIILAKGCSKKTNNQENDGGVSYVDKKATVVFGKTNLTLNVGDSEKLEADVLNRDSFELIWYQNDPTIVDIDEQGNITALSEGETEVFALYKENDIVVSQASCTVIVTEKEVPPEKISLGQDDISLKLGDTLLLQVSISPVEAKMSDIVFESDLPDIVSIDEKGYITANSVGKAKITAKSKDGNISDSITVTVTETGETEINPTNLILFGLSNGLTVGGTSKMEYKLLPDNATNTEITWTSSDPSIATVDDAIVTGHKAGKCIIIATTENGLSYQQEIIVESDAIPVTSISINGENSITIPLGGTRLLSYKVLPENATNKNVSYTVNNSSVLFVDSNGFVAAIGVGNSLVTITTEDGKKTAIVNVTVTNNSSSSNSNESSETITGNSPGGSVDDTNTTDNSSSSNDVSSDTSSSDSSSSTNSNESSSSYTVSSDSSSSNSCNVNSFAIKSNQDGAVTSNNRFENAKSFTKPNAGLKVTAFDSCINKSKSYYDLWFAKDSNSLNTSRSATLSKQPLPTLGNTLYLNQGDGLYYIKAYIITNDGASYYKYYYAIVENGGKNTNTINITSTLNSTGTKFTVKNVSSSTIKLAACITKSSTTSDKCNPQLNNSACASSNCQISGYKTLSKNGTTTYSITQNTSLTPTPTRGGKICFRAYDTSGNLLSDTQCEVVKKSASTTTNSTSISNYITLSSTTVSSGNSIKITKKSNSVKKVYYCIRKDTSSCVPVVNKNGINNGVYYSYFPLSSSSFSKSIIYSNTNVNFDRGVKICFKPFGDSSFLTTQTVCAIVKK